MSFKPLVRQEPRRGAGRLHFAAHSHHLWPDASFEGQVECWEDAAALADPKWDKVMDEVWPEAQGHVAASWAAAMPSAIVFASNTHDFLIRLAAACPRRGRAAPGADQRRRIPSARRQFARWAETGDIELTKIAAEPFDDFSRTLSRRRAAGEHDLILVSQVLFNSGRMFERWRSWRRWPAGRAVGGDRRLSRLHGDRSAGLPAIAASAFYLGGGYKYAMAGEGMGFMHCPPGFGERPPVTGWFAEFGDLTAPPGSRSAIPGMRCASWARPSIRRRSTGSMRSSGCLKENGLTTADRGACRRPAGAAARRIAGTALGEAELLNPLGDGPHARFLAFRDSQARSAGAPS